MKKKLITETTHNIEKEWVTEASGSKSLYIEGIFSTAENMVTNGRKYKRDVLEREVDRLMKKVRNSTAVGELDHPPSAKINQERGVILIKELKWAGNDVHGKAKVLNTRLGKDVQSLIEDGVRLGISSRGLGTIDEITKYVNEDFELITYDVVGDPSNQKSWVNGIYEGKEFESESISDKEKKIEEMTKRIEELEGKLKSVREELELYKLKEVMNELILSK